MDSANSALLWEVLHGAYTRLGLSEAVGDDRAFEQMILAHVIEPTTCKAQVPRVLGDLGLESISTRTLSRSLGRAQERGYRETLSNALFEHVTNAGVWPCACRKVILGVSWVISGRRYYDGPLPWGIMGVKETSP